MRHGEPHGCFRKCMTRAHTQQAHFHVPDAAARTPGAQPLARGSSASPSPPSSPVHGKWQRRHVAQQALLAVDYSAAAIMEGVAN